MLGWHGVCGFFGLWYEVYVLVYQLYESNKVSY